MSRTQINLRYPDPTFHQLVREKAEAAGLTVSEFMRRAALGRRMACVVDVRMVGELRRLGAMLKHRYPKDSNWSLEEKREYWVAMERIMALADKLDEVVSKKR